MLLIIAVMFLHSISEGVRAGAVLAMRRQRGVVWCGVVWCGVVWCGVANAAMVTGVDTVNACCQIGIGVAFAGSGGSKFGLFITATLAIHNIPEGLAVGNASLGVDELLWAGLALTLLRWCCCRARLRWF